MVWTRHCLEDDLECVLIDNYENSGPHRREGRRMRRAKRGGYCKALLDRNSGQASLLIFHDVMISAFKFGGN